MRSLLIATTSFFFTLIIFFDPSGLMLGLKAPVFSLYLLTFSMYLIINQTINYNLMVCQVLFLTVGFFGVFIGQMNGGDSDFSLSMLGAITFIISMSPIFYYIKYFEQSVILVSILFVAFLFFISLVHLGLVSNGNFSSLINYLNYEVKNAMITWRDFLGFRVPMVYYKSVILLIVAIAVSSELSDRYKLRRYKFLLFVFVLILALSGTRTNMAVSMLILLAIILNTYRNRIAISIILFISLPLLLYFAINIIFLNDTGDNLVKSSNLNDYINLISSPSYLFLGEGFGSGFYSSVHSKFVLNTELVYFDIFRWLGVLPGLLFFVFLLFPCYIFALKKKFNLFGCYFGYFLIMGSNPLLLSSTGMFLVSYFFAKAILLINPKCSQSKYVDSGLRVKHMGGFLD